MNPEDWDEYARAYGQDVASQKLGPRPAPVAAPEAAPAPERPGMVSGSLRSAAQGATFGLADEAAAGWAGLGAMLPGGRSPAEAVEETLGSERRKIREFREDHPVVSFGSELAGGVATGFGAGRAAKTTAVGARAAGRGAGRVVAESAAAGALTGAGTAEGGVRERIRGGAVGAAAGAAFGTAIRGAGRFGSALLDRVGLRPRGAPAAAGRTGAAAPPTPPDRFAHRATRALGIESVDDRANRKVLEGLGQENLGPDDVSALATTSGKPVTIADAGDRKGSLVKLAATAQSLPSAASGRMAGRFRERAVGELDRVRQAFARTTGLPQEFAEDTAEDIIQRRAATHGPEYNRVLDAVPVVDDPRVTELLGSDRGSISRGIEAARKIAGEEGREAFVEGQPLSARDLHYLKLGVDDVLRGMARQGEAGGAKGTLYGKMNQTRQELLGLMDDAVPGYQDVRANWAGESSMLDALEAGGTLFDRSTDFRSVRKVMDAMTPDERQMYRRAALDDLLYKLGDMGDGHDRSRRVIGTPNLREKVRLLFDDPAQADAFLADANLESRMHATGAAFEGSRTAVLAAGQDDLLEDAITNPRRAFSPMEMAGRVVGGVANRARRLTDQRVTEAVGDRLSAGTSSRADLDRVLEELRGYSAKQLREEARRAATERGAAVAGGATGERLRSGR